MNTFTRQEYQRNLENSIRKINQEMTDLNRVKKSLKLALAKSKKLENRSKDK